MSDSTPRLSIPELVSMQEANCVTWNEALVQLDAFVDLYLLGQFTNTPPASPADGDAYLLGGSPTGAWSGYAYKIASCIDGAWRFYTPFNGLRAWVATTGAFIVYVGGTWTDWNSLISANEGSIASAATCDLSAAGSLFVQITGTTTITSFGTGANKLRFVRFAGALTLTHNATSLILLGGASRTTAAGDVGIYASDGNGNWRERSYLRASSNPGDVATKSGAETLTNKTLGATYIPNGIIDANGNVGIGTQSPASGFGLVVATSGNPLMQFNGGSGLAGGFYYYNGATAGAGFIFFPASDSRAFAFLDSSLSNTHAPMLIMQNKTVGIGDGIQPRTGATLDVGGHVFPHADNSYNLGSASYRWGTVYAATGTINTSGAASKTNIRAPADAEIAVAKALAANIRVFQFCDAAAKKGADAARLHIGMIYEDVVAAFAAHGLDPLRYGIVCRDPATKMVTKTRRVSRAKTQTVTVRRERIAVVGGVATLTTVDETREEPVVKIHPLVDADGAPVVDPETGMHRIHFEPETEDVEETTDEIEPDLDENGAQKWMLGLRYDELAQFVIAGLAARIAALEVK